MGGVSPNAFGSGFGRAHPRAIRLAAIAAIAGIPWLTSCAADDRASEPTTTTSSTRPLAASTGELTPPPFEQGQRIGLPDEWELVVRGADVSDKLITVRVQFANLASRRRTIPAQLALFTFRNELYAAGTPARDVSTSSESAEPGASADVVIRFDRPEAMPPHPVLFFHGDQIGSKATTVLLDARESPPAE